MIRILLGGDICPTGSVEGSFIKGDAPAIFHDLLDDIRSADLSIVNLECPLVTEKTPINKARAGEVMSADTACIQGFSVAKWRLLNLANNHSFDHGARGLQETIRAIHEAGLSVVGAGSNIEEAESPFVAEIAGHRIVVYSMAEREFSIADEQTPGANPLDMIRCVQAIRLYKDGGLFIVLIHGGLEFSPYPSPEMVRRCRFLVEMGADAVICFHPHLPLPWETYRGRPIVYGMGNLVFEFDNPMQNPPAGWHDGYLSKLIIENGQVSFVPVPYHQGRPVLGARRMDEASRHHFLRDMHQRNARLEDAVFLQSEWSRYCEKERKLYLSILFGDSRWRRKVSQFFNSSGHSNDALLRSLLLSQCESHLEVLNTIFRELRRAGR